jgi:putative transposon-encoded protein
LFDRKNSCDGEKRFRLLIRERAEKGERVERDKKQKRIKKPVDMMDKSKVKFEVYGEEMLEKVVSLSGNSGRIYLPPDWVGHQVKIVRID